MTKIDDPMQLMADLKPAMLDRLAEEGYSRRRHDDLARAVAQGPASRSPVRRHWTSAPAPGHLTSAPAPGPWTSAGHGRRRWPLLAAGSAMTAAAVAAAVVLTAAPPQSGRHAPPHSGQHVPPAAAPDARAILLASAVIARRAPVTAGSYFYVRAREFWWTTSTSGGVKRAFGTALATTQESWSGPARTRTIVGEDARITFASAAGKARWKAAGEPKVLTAAGWAEVNELTGSISARPATSNYHMSGYWGAGKSRLTWAQFRALPVTADALGKTLRRMWNAEPDKAAAVGFPHPGFGQYLVQWADALLTGPATPGARAAIYALLAGQPGIQIVSNVSDPLGRSGVAVSDGGGDYLVIDPHTAQILAFTSNPVHPGAAIAATTGVTIYEAMGWAKQLGGPAQP